MKANGNQRSVASGPQRKADWVSLGLALVGGVVGVLIVGEWPLVAAAMLSTCAAGAVLWWLGWRRTGRWLWVLAGLCGISVVILIWTYVDSYSGILNNL